MAYFGRTLYFNGPRASVGAKEFLRDERDVADPRALAKLLARGSDPIGTLLDRVIAVCYPRLGRGSLAEKRARWEFAEPTLNARCRLALALLEPRAVRAMLGNLLPIALPGSTARLARINPALDNKGRFGTPDVLVEGTRSTTLIEMKVRGLPTRHMYDLKQLVQYVNLSLDHRRIQGRTHRTVHVLLRPEGGGRVCKRRSEWFPDPVNGAPIAFEHAAVWRAAARYRWRSALAHRVALRELARFQVFERTYRELIAAIPEGVWSTGHGAMAQHQMTLLVRNSEPQIRPREV